MENGMTNHEGIYRGQTHIADDYPYGLTNDQIDAILKEWQMPGGRNANQLAAAYFAGDNGNKGYNRIQKIIEEGFRATKKKPDFASAMKRTDQAIADLQAPNFFPFGLTAQELGGIAEDYRAGVGITNLAKKYFFSSDGRFYQRILCVLRKQGITHKAVRGNQHRPSAKKVSTTKAVKALEAAEAPAKPGARAEGWGGVAINREVELQAELVSIRHKKMQAALSSRSKDFKETVTNLAATVSELTRAAGLNEKV